MSEARFDFSKRSLREGKNQVETLRSWLHGPMKFKRCFAPVCHSLFQAMGTDKIVSLETGRRINVLPVDQHPHVDHHIFIINHDWAAALAGATDYEGGEFKPPYDHGLFEFNIDDHRVVCMCFWLEDKEQHCVVVCIECDGIWVTAGPNYFKDGSQIDRLASSEDPIIKGINRLIGIVYRQMKAACVMLETGSADAQTVHVPERINKKRVARGDLPLSGYNVVSLRRRSTAIESAEHSGTRRRLHFRRGHWRRHADTRVWVRWCLVGDPDLGFIDKHYAL